MKTIFNLDTNEFETENNQQLYLTVMVDEERSDKAEVITIIDKTGADDFGYIREELKGTTTVLAMNSEDDEDTFKAVELFNQKDYWFILHVDFYSVDNFQRLIDVIEQHELMDFNGYCHYNNDNFHNQNDKPCYIPENAEDRDDVFNYQQLIEQVNNWVKDNQWYVDKHETDAESILESMFTDLSWEHPSTFLENLTY